MNRRARAFARIAAAPLALVLMGNFPVPPKELRGRQNATCRPNEPGPAVRVTVQGLKDRRGMLRLELFPANDDDFLEDDKVLIREGKTFKRVDMPVPASGTPGLCVRAPRPGTYTIAVLHDRNGDQKFSALGDGVGFPGDPHLGLKRPPASAATITIGDGVLQTDVTLQYLRGLRFAPLKR